MQLHFFNLIHAGHAERRALAALLLVTLAGTGCGGKSRPAPLEKVFPVEGQVRLNGKPLAGAEVTFYPKAAGTVAKSAPGATATTDAAGGYKLRTYAKDDGAFPGEHAVVITYSVSTQTGPQGDTIAGPNVLAPKYSDRKATQLTARVEEGPTTVPAFDLQQDIPALAAKKPPAGEGGAAEPAAPATRPAGSD